MFLEVGQVAAKPRLLPQDSISKLHLYEHIQIKYTMLIKTLQFAISN
jgi:hypothetical protein